jgi:hypothetical protein
LQLRNIDNRRLYQKVAFLQFELFEAVRLATFRANATSPEAHSSNKAIDQNN